MNQFKDFVQELYDFFRNIIVSAYNFLNHYIPAPILLGLGIVLGAFIICVAFKKISER